MITYTNRFKCFFLNAISVYHMPIRITHIDIPPKENILTKRNSCTA